MTPTDRSGLRTRHRGGRRRCDICRHLIAYAGPSYDLRQVGGVRSGPGKLRFRFCQFCYSHIASSLERTIKKNWGDDA
jgi:hypothetical protein